MKRKDNFKERSDVNLARVSIISVSSMSASRAFNHFLVCHFCRLKSYKNYLFTELKFHIC